jgi:hypothetical protein
MSDGFKEGRERIERARKELERRIKETTIIVVLLGAGGKGVDERRVVKGKLEAEGIIALVPEDDFGQDYAPSLAGESVLEKADIDLIFVNVESWGSVTEFSQFRENQNTCCKLRVMVEHQYHPLYGHDAGLLTDTYLTHLAKHGHVYAYDRKGGSVFPTSERIVTLLARRYRELRATGKV